MDKEYNPLLICRHKTSITRTKLSRPCRIALSKNIINTNTTVLDYGCGKGLDVVLLNNLGVKTVGFDPHYFPRDFHGRYRSDVVFLNYVLNVIENPLERKDVLIDAVMLTKKYLIIAVRHTKDIKNLEKYEKFGDGIITKRNTFQKLYEHEELESWVNSIIVYPTIRLSRCILLISKDM